MGKHILVVSQYFHPEQFRINDICTEWVKRGHRVTVVTGIPNYPRGRYYDGYGLFKRRKEIYEGVNIIRIPIIPRGGNSVTLCLNYLSFVVSGFFWKATASVNADCVFIFGVSPMTQALVGVWYAAKKRIPCYLYVQDLWPENVQAVAGITNRLVIGFIGRMVDYIYARCTRIFVTSEGFIEAIRSRGVVPDKIEYWPQYAEDFYRPLPRRSVNEIPRDGLFNITFTGNIGNAQGLDILPQTAVLLKNMGLSGRVRFNIVGDGRYKEKLIGLVNQRQVSEMFRFIPKQSASRIPELLAASDVAFLCLMEGPFFRMTVPAKLQSYMACGIPIIASADGETSRVVNEARAGICCPAGDAQKLAEAITDLLNLPQQELDKMGANARSYYESHFSKEKLLDRMDRCFEAD